jgi:hypothetical protein
MLDSLPYDWLLLATLAVSVIAGGRVFLAAAVIAADWLLYCAAWEKHSPAALAARLGAEMTHADIWATTDTLAAIAIFCVARWRLWSLAIIALLFLQIMAHSLYDNGLAASTYGHVLNVTFLAQLMALFITGGRRCGSSLRVFATHVLGRGVDLFDAHKRKGRA